MNKNDLIKALTPALGQRVEAKKSVEKILHILQHTIRSGEKVVLSGIGSFHPKIRNAQRRHNPKTMEPVHVPTKRTVKFIPSEDLFSKDS